MVRSGDREPGDTARSERAAPSTVVGKIRSLAGSVTVVHADGSAAHAEVGCTLFQGDRIETGGDGRVGISFADGTEFNLANDARITIGEFDRDGVPAPNASQIQVAQGRFAFVAGKARGFSIDLPQATLRPSPQACAVATLTLVGFTIALLQKLEAAGSGLITLDELIKYKDHLEHGDLLIIPKGGKPILLDDPEITIVVDANFVVTTLANSPADMARLLGISAEGDNTYDLGAADPFTTGSTTRAETHLFFPNGPNQQQASNNNSPLPPNEDDPNAPPPPDGGGGNNAPQPVLVLTLNEELVVEHDHTLLVQSGGDIDDTDEEFPIDLSDLPGFDENEIIGQATDGGGEDDDPFVSTAGSSGPVLITLEPSTDGVDSGLDVTGGDSIFLFTETTDGEQVVVGREGGESGPIAFIIFVTPDGEALWVQEFLPIDHGADGNNHDGLLPIDNDALILRGTLIGTSLTQTFPIGQHIVFVDDGPSINVAAGDDALVLLTTQDAETDGDPTDQDAATSTANFGGVFSIASQSFGTDGAGVAPTLGYALSLTVAEGTASGLFSDGVAIKLYEINGVIIGSTADTEGAAEAAKIFTLSVGANGGVTLTQFAEVDHPGNGDDAPPYDDQVAVLGNNLVKLTASATIQDGDTDTASDSDFIDLGGNIRFADDGPSIDVVAVNEASVVLTTHDDGDPDTDSSTANFSGVFSIDSQSFGADGPGTATTLAYALSLAVAEGAASGLFSDDAAINLYDIEGIITGSTAATEDDVEAANTIFTLSVDATTGVVTQTQFAEIDHAGPGDGAPPYDAQVAVLGNNLVKLTASATISDEETDSDSDSAFIDLGGNIQFADDGPGAAPVSENLAETTGADTNVLLIFDLSGSMGDPSGLTNLSRLDLAKAAANELLEQYENQGDVRVQIITFSDTAAKQGNTWVTVDAAKTFIAALSAGGNSDYDDAAALGPDAFDDAGKLATPGVRNVSYFISDNSPNPASDGLSGSEITNWQNFLNGNEILSHALAMGTGIGTTALNPLAYDGRGAGTDTNGTIVTDPAQAPFLPSPTTLSPESGTLVPPGSFGADGGFVKSITIDGVTYTYDPTSGGSISSSGAFSFDTTTNTLTVALASLATFAIDMDDGVYTYTPPASVSSDISEEIGFTLSDGDFDTASNTLTINVVDADQPPMARDDLVITNINGDGASIVIPDFALLYNDTDPNGQTIAVKTVSAPSSGTVTDNAGSVTFTDGAGSDNGGAFTYTGETQPPVGGTADEDTGRVTVDREQENDGTMQGTGLGEILIGRTSADSITAFAGNDVLIGGNGALTTTTPQVVFRIIADGGTGSPNSDFLQFDFLGGLAGTDFVQSITIDLNAGPEDDAVFDPQGGNADGRGPSFSNFNGAGFSASDVDVEPDNGDNTTGTLSLTFDADQFTVGRSFDLDIDIDNLGGGSDANSGEEFEDSGVQATITLQDGRTQTLTFTDGADEDDDSQVTFTFAGQVIPATDDTLDGGAGDDLLWGQGGNDVLIGGTGSDKYLFQPGEGGVDQINLFEAVDEILVDVASQSLTALTAVGIDAADFASGNDTSAGFNGSGREFFFEADANTLWYSPTGLDANKMALATISSGVDPDASDIKIF